MYDGWGVFVQSQTEIIIYYIYSYIMNKMNIESVIPKIEFEIIWGSNKNKLDPKIEIFFLKNTFVR